MTAIDKHSPMRDAGKEHVPIYPRFFIVVRIVQLILAVVCLGLSGYGVSVVPWAGNALMIFTAIATMIASSYILATTMGPAAKAYNYWAVLGLDVFLLVFWLVSFALMAVAAAALLYLASYYNSDSSSSYYDFDETYYSAIVGRSTVARFTAAGGAKLLAARQSYDDYSDYYDDYYDYYSSSSDQLSDIYMVWGAIAAAAAALGAINFALYIASLTIHSCAIRRHRKAGLHCKPGVPATTTTMDPSQPPPVGAIPAPMPMYGGQQQPPMMQQQQQQGYPPQMQQPPMGYPPQQPVPMYEAPPGGMYAAPPPQVGQQQQQQQQVSPQPSAASPIYSQTTGGSYVQGAPVSLDGSGMAPPPVQQQHTGGAVYETHGESKGPAQLS